MAQDNQIENRFHFETITDADFIFDSSITQDPHNIEFIARSTYGKVANSELKPEFGFEIAKNKLTSHSIFFQDGVQQSLNGGHMVVEELRSCVVKFLLPLSIQQIKKLSFEGGLTVEISEIKVSGDATQQQSFNFLKPRFSATYKFNKQNQFALELERSVGQLNFNDFAASSQIPDI